MKKFIISLLLFSVIIYLIGFTISYAITDQYISPIFELMIAFYFAVTVIFHLVMQKVQQKSHSGFMNGFMIATMGKLLLLMSVLLIYVLLHKDQAVVFILNFFVLYVFYTVFEVIHASRQGHKNQIKK